MKIDTSEIAKSGHPKIRLLTGREEAEIIHSLTVHALNYSLRLGMPEENISRLKNIKQCLGRALSEEVIPREPGPRSKRRIRKMARHRRFLLGLREMWSLLDAPVNGDAAERITRLREMFVEAQQAGIAVAKEIV